MVSKKSTLLSLLMLCFFSIQMVWAIDVTWQTLNTGSTIGKTLDSGYYVVTQNTTFSNSTAGGSGLTVASGATVRIFIPAGVTLTCSGANANGVTGAGAGIHVPSNATIYFYGAGTVSATGGNAAQGSMGANGQSYFWSDDPNYFYAFGGAGGNGGGGAGAGIGTPGGNGGAGGTRVGHNKVYVSEKLSKNGVAGNNGTQGGTANDAGKVYCQNTITVNATGGSAATTNTSHASASGYQTHTWSRRYTIGGSGYGGTGGSGLAANNIGAGGPGGGGAGSGGSGGIDWSEANRVFNSYGGNGGDGTNTTSTKAGTAGVRGRSSDGYNSDIVGGNGGTGARAGVTKAVGSVLDGGAVPNDYCKYVIYNANGGAGSMAQQIVMPLEIINNSAVIQANQYTREGFDFVGWNTQADGTGDTYEVGAMIIDDTNSNKAITLYAQWTAQTITATFDYTYRTSEQTGEETYENMTDTDDAFTTKVRANFRDASNAVLSSVVLTAPEATTPGGTPTDEISTHKTASITLNVVKGTEESLSNSGSAYTLTLDATKYTNYRSVDFEVMNTAGNAVAPHWASSKQNATNYLFKYEGHESSNMFELGWRVNLKKLSMYPANIFVKPMRTGATDEQIPAMLNTNGIQCNIAGYFDASGNDVTIDAYNAKNAEEKAEFNKNGGAYYTGEYRVLSTNAQAEAYNYKIGLTGFILDGITYYLAETAGDIPNDMISSDVASSTESAAIEFDRFDKDIPVLILSPNGENATVSGRANYKLYVDNNTARTVNLAQFVAIRPNYDFVGWMDAYDKTVYSAEDDYHFNMGVKATTTFLAQWKRSNAPSVVGNDVVENESNFIYNVKVTDDLNDIKSVQYIYTDNDTEPAADAPGWADMPVSNGNYTLTIPMINDNYGKYLWVKAENADKHAIIGLGEIRSIYKVKANPDPDSHVVDQIPNGTWSGEGEDAVFTPDGTTTDVNMYDYYSTFYFGDRTFIANNASVYTAQINGNHLDLTEIKPSSEDAPVIIPKGTAVILRKKQATDGEIVLEECAQSNDIYSNDLEGVDENTTQDGDNYYIFSYAQKGLGFYLNSSTTLAAHKAFICLENGQSDARAFTLNFDNSEITGIEEVVVEDIVETTEAESNALYDLSGRQVNAANAKGGIYIKNGKKVMIK